MTYLTDLADKVVESVDPYEGEWGLFDKVAVVKFVDDPHPLSIHIDSRSFYYRGKEIDTGDLDKITYDRRMPTIRTPDPPNFRLPVDPVLFQIMKAFKTLRIGLMNYYGSHHKDANAEFEEVVTPWQETVRRYFGYRRGNNLTLPGSVSIQTNERRAQWSLKLSNSRAMKRLARMLQSLSSGSRRKVRRA
jgi:hypothetical protein